MKKARRLTRKELEATIAKLEREVDSIATAQRDDARRYANDVARYKELNDRFKDRLEAIHTELIATDRQRTDRDRWLELLEVGYCCHFRFRQF